MNVQSIKLVVIAKTEVDPLSALRSLARPTTIQTPTRPKSPIMGQVFASQNDFPRKKKDQEDLSVRNKKAFLTCRLPVRLF